MGPERHVCTHSLENGLAGVTPMGGAVDVFKVMESGSRSHLLSGHLRNRGTLANPGNGGAGLCSTGHGAASLCLSLDGSRQPGSGVWNEKQLWEHVGPAPPSPSSEKLRMDALLDGMRRGHSVPGSCVHVEGSHTNTHDLCPGLSGWSGLARAPLVRPPHRTPDSALALGSVGGPEALLHWPPPPGSEGTSPCPCQLGTDQRKLRGVGTRV